MDTHRTIKSLTKEDRPREKLLNLGRRNLSTSELLAILIRSGSTRASALEVAHTLFQRYGNSLSRLAQLEVRELCQEEGIGEAKAITISAALELGIRKMAESVIEKPVVKSSRDAFEIIGPRLYDLPYEEFWLICLNRANKVIKMAQVSSGGVTSTSADPKKIFKLALDHLSCGLILCHNHPSGNLKPSNTDMELTRRIASGAEILDMKLLDHIIVSADQYFSFADESLI